LEQGLWKPGQWKLGQLEWEPWGPVQLEKGPWEPERWEWAGGTGSMASAVSRAGVSINSWGTLLG